MIYFVIDIYFFECYNLFKVVITFEAVDKES